MSENTYLTYYQKNKERLRVPARGKYRNLSEQEKIKKESTGRIGITICLKKKNKD